MARIEMTREEFHRRVWTTPPRKLADELEISIFDLGNACTSFRIGRPSEGHWNAIRQGRSTDVPPLDPDENLATKMVKFDYRSNPQPPSEARDISAFVAKAAAVISDIRVRENSSVLHRVAAQLLKDDLAHLKEIRDNQWRRHNSYDAAIHMEPSHRLYRVLDALLRAVEAIGGRISKREQDLITLTIDDASICFRLRWRQRKHSGKLPEERKALGLQWDKDFSSTLISSGFLALEVQTYLPSVRKEWIETSKERFMDFLPEILGDFLRYPLIQRAENEIKRALDAERQREKERTRRAREEEAIQSATWEQFLDLASRYRQYADARALLREITERDFDAAAPAGPATVRDWIDWAEANLARLDPLADGVAEAFAQMAGRARASIRPKHSWEDY